MKLLYSMIFNIVFIAVCSFDATLLARPKSLENAYNSCGLNGSTCAARLRSHLKAITLSSTQNDIFDLIKLSLPCVHCDCCHNSIETTMQDFFYALSSNNKKRIKRLRFFVISSVLQSCKSHEKLTQSSFQKSKKWSLCNQIQEDYQDYREYECEELTEEQVFEKRACN